MRMVRVVLAGSIALLWASTARSDDVPAVAAPSFPDSAFELCVSCASEEDFVRYAKFTATKEAGEHMVMIGNTETGEVYKITYDVAPCPVRDWNCNISIGSVERQNEATRQDFIEMVRLFRK